MANRIAKNKLLIFAKAPTVGEVKTRLQPLLTPQQSTDFHRRLVEHCLIISSGARDITIELWVANEHEWWSELSARYGVNVRIQNGMDLGGRMAQAFESTLSEANNVVIIGTDCPFIDSQYIETAFEELGQAELVLGPAEDGGYVLIGLIVYARSFLIKLIGVPGAYYHKPIGRLTT